MKKALILLIFYISSLLSNDSLNDLFVNDAPVWIEIPQQTIDEDCQNGCVNGIFLLICYLLLMIQMVILLQY